MKVHWAKAAVALAMVGVIAYAFVSTGSTNVLWALFIPMWALTADW